MSDLKPHNNYKTLKTAINRGLLKSYFNDVAQY